MAYYDDGYMWPQEHTTYDPLDYQDSVSFSCYEPHGLDSYGTHIVSEFQDPSADYEYDYGYARYSYSCANPDINYYVEPKLLTYESAPGFISYHTKYSISYSKMDSGFNEPEFVEYDPTPYGGGYDIISTYGKPLPPSDKTCYPRSNPERVEPISTPIPMVEAKLEPEHESVSRPKPHAVHVPVPVVMSQPIPDPTPDPLNEPEGLELEEPGERERERDEYSDHDYRYDYPWPEYDSGNRTGMGYDYGYGKQVVQIPPFEYDSDVVDLCENIFGNWPCLAKIRNQQRSIDNKPRITYPENEHRNPLEECASYIFGRPM